MSAAPKTGDTYLSFNGTTSYVKIGSRPEYSLPTRNTLTVSTWIKPDTVEFPNQEGSNYVHWMGKGDGHGTTGRHEWAFRMYSYTTTDKPCPRPNRTSFYVFNPEGGQGTGSHAEERVEIGEWMHLVGVADAGCTHFFKNGVFKDCDIYRVGGACTARTPVCKPGSDPVIPVAGNAQLRIGTRDRKSYFQGGITRVRIWGRVLTADEIRDLYETDAAPRDDLVAEYLLNKDQADDAMDTSSLKNHGTVVHGTWAVM